jgi:hypothetical protein
VVEARGVGEKVVKGEAGLVLRHSREVLRERILHPQLARLLELEDGGGGELLGDGPDVEHRVRRAGGLAAAVAQAVTLAQEDLAVTGHEHGAGEAGRLQGLEVVVEAGARSAAHHRARIRVRGGDRPRPDERGERESMDEPSPVAEE